MATGYIKLYRKIQNHDLWEKEPFSSCQAWIDLLLSANWKDGSFYKRNIRIEQSRGQVAFSIRGMARRWKWSQGRVRRFLDNLKSDAQIEYQTTNVTTVVTILNYEQYQGRDEQEGAQTEHKRGTDASTGGSTDGSTNGDNIRIEEVKEEKKRKKKTDEDVVSGLKFAPELDTPQARGSLVEWLAYKRKRGETYKAPEVQLNKLLKQFNSPDDLSAAIDKSIANNWAGCFPPKGRGDGKANRGGLVHGTDWGELLGDRVVRDTD